MAPRNAEQRQVETSLAQLIRPRRREGERERQDKEKARHQLARLKGSTRPACTRAILENLAAWVTL
eukprot:10018748-Heterocapsa_arctica.AAC.1